MCKEFHHECYYLPCGHKMENIPSVLFPNAERCVYCGYISMGKSDMDSYESQMNSLRGDEEALRGTYAGNTTHE